ASRRRLEASGSTAEPRTSELLGNLLSRIPMDVTSYPRPKAQGRASPPWRRLCISEVGRPVTDRPRKSGASIRTREACVQTGRPVVEGVMGSGSDLDAQPPRWRLRMAPPNALDATIGREAQWKGERLEAEDRAAATWVPWAMHGLEYVKWLQRALNQVLK